MNCSHFLGSCCYAFREEPAEGTRSSFLFHWKASQSATTFADKRKARPRTFGSLGKVFFFFFCNTYMHTAALGTTSAQRLLVIICLHQPSSQVPTQAAGFNRLCCERQPLGHPNPSKGQSQLGAGHSVTTTGQLQGSLLSPHLELGLFPTKSPRLLQ